MRKRGVLGLTAHDGRRAGLADEVAIHFLAVGGEQFQAAAVTLIGEEVFLRACLVETYLMYLPFTRR